VTDDQGAEQQEHALGAGDTLDAIDPTPEELAVLAKVAEIVRKIQYGTVVLVIQDGKVVQIEMAEKFRMR
jgi:hypothetical protein